MIGIIVAVVIIVVALLLVLPSLRVIGPTDVGLVRRRIGSSLPPDNPVAFKGEAGYQDKLLMPGVRFKFWPIYSVTRYPFVQIPAGEIGVVIAQVGEELPIGAKSAIYKEEFGQFNNLNSFMRGGGQKGVQRPVLPPGTLAPFHPVGFLVVTKTGVYGKPVSSDLVKAARKDGGLKPSHFGLSSDSLKVTIIKPENVENISEKYVDLISSRAMREQSIIDTVGIVTVFEGKPLPSGDIASRLGGFDDITDLEQKADTSDSDIIEVITGTKNELHNNYQDFQEFLDKGGRIGLQHDPLLYGAYNLNPFLVSVEVVPMLVVEQGEVAVIKAYVGQVTEDTSGDEFKYGSLVKPGHRGIWREPLRTGKYTINPRCYQAEIVPTAIVTLNWANEYSEAHKLDQRLKPIVAKSREGFVFTIDLQVLIHVSDTKAPKVISMVGTIQNLVDEVLQSAIGNHFRDKLQSLPAVKFIETRQEVQEQSMEFIQGKLTDYFVETLGVYIQDVILPEQLVTVLTDREIANQEIATYKKQKEAQEERINTEHAMGTADKQKELASSQVEVEIKKFGAEAKRNEAEGVAAYTTMTGEAEGKKEKAIGEGKAAGYVKQVEAMGQSNTALVNAIQALAQGSQKFVPEVLVAGGNGSLEGLAASLIKKIEVNNNPKTSTD